MSSQLITNKHFCLIPWTHLHIWPNGKTFMCCVAPFDSLLGTLTETTSIKDLWNSQRLKENRLLMLADKPVPDCKRCYEIESTGGTSQRLEQNRVFKHHLGITKTTLSDGTVEKVNMPYMDIRFSNICNLRCRTCGPELSSRWAADKNILNNTNTTAAGRSGILRPLENDEVLWEQVRELLPTVEQIYFAGGEPLLMEEHYRLLNMLIDEGRTNIRLSYNTNFTKNSYKSQSIYKLWSKFEDVTVGASLDAPGIRAEYMRKDTIWSDILANRKQMRSECPHVKFYINMTLSVFNFAVAHTFHKEMIETGFILDHEFHINLLTYPDWYRANITSEQFRDEVITQYKEHINWLTTRSSNKTLISDWNSAVNYISGPQLTANQEQFIVLTTRLDKIRGEQLLTACPELATIYE